jgi:hypothetical protein
MWEVSFLRARHADLPTISAPTENAMNAGKLMMLLVHALVGWALCAAIMGISLATLPRGEALIIHALAAPIIFVFVSRSYFQRFACTTPLQTAFIFVAIIILVDLFVVAPSVDHSLDMFASLLGTWIPFLLIFTATHITGLVTMIVSRRPIPVR